MDQRTARDALHALVDQLVNESYPLESAKALQLARDAAIAEAEKLREAARTAELDAQTWQERATKGANDLVTVKAERDQLLSENISLQEAIDCIPNSPAVAEGAGPSPRLEPDAAAGDVVCRCGHTQAEHAGGVTYCEGLCETHVCFCLKFEAVKEGAGGGIKSGPLPSTDGDNRAVSPSNGGEIPRQPSAPAKADSGADVGGAAVSAELPQPKWGRAAVNPLACHLFREGFSESECKAEVCDGEIEWLDLKTVDPETICGDCAEMVPNDPMPKLAPAAVAKVAWKLCAGMNKAAGVPCTSEARPNSDFCGRHGPKVKKAQEKAA